MSNDLVKRLRAYAEQLSGYLPDMLQESADRIEALESALSLEHFSRRTAVDEACEVRDRIEVLENALRRLVAGCKSTSCDVYWIARAALEGKND